MLHLPTRRGCAVLFLGTHILFSEKRIGRKEKDASLAERRESSYWEKSSQRRELFLKDASALSILVAKGKERAKLKVKGRGHSLVGKA